MQLIHLGSVDALTKPADGFGWVVKRRNRAAEVINAENGSDDDVTVRLFKAGELVESFSFYPETEARARIREHLGTWVRDVDEFELPPKGTLLSNGERVLEIVRKKDVITVREFIGKSPQNTYTITNSESAKPRFRAFLSGNDDAPA